MPIRIHPKYFYQFKLQFQIQFSYPFNLFYGQNSKVTIEYRIWLESI